MGDTCGVRHVACIRESVEKDYSTRTESIRSVRRLFVSEVASREI
jgi:hypothetical protein